MDNTTTFTIENSIVKLNISNNIAAHTECEVQTFEPATAEEAQLGKLIIISQISLTDSHNKEIIEAISQEVKENYYSAEASDPETAFEQAIQKLNKQLNQLYTSKDIKKNWLNNLNILIAVVNEAQLYLAPVGQVSALMMWQDKVIDIYEAPEKDQINPLKIFSQILSGELREEAIVVLSNQSFKNYLTLEKIKQSLNLPFEEISRHLKNIFWPINNLSLGAAIISRRQMEAKEAINQKTSRISSPQNSMDNLLGMQAKTQSLLSSSFLADLKKIAQRGQEYVRVNVMKKRPMPKLAEITSQPEAKSQPKKDSLFSKIVYKILVGIKVTFAGIKNFFVGAFGLVSKAPQAKDRIKGSPYEVEGSIVRAVNRLKRLPKKSQMLLAIAVLLIFIFTGSIVIQGMIKDNKVSDEDYQQMLVQIDEKANSIEANISIKNFTKAREFLQELETNLASLPQKTKEEKQKHQEIQTRLSELYDKANQLTNIKEPMIFSDLETVTDSTEGVALGYLNDQLFAAGKNKSAYAISDEGSVTLLDTGLPEDLPEFITAKELGDLWILAADKRIIEFDADDDSFEEKNITFTNEEATIKDIATYQNNRVYFLSPTTNQIYKHSRYENYGTGSPWKTDESVNLEDAVSIAVDGYLWALKANGEVVRMLSGNREDWTLEDFEPALAGATKIFTDTSTQNLYILDPPNKRLIVADKAGKLINQYRSDQFDNLSDFVILEAQKVAYLLNGKKIYKIQL